MEQKLNKKSILTLLIVLIVTITIAVLGITYAYFQIIVNSVGTSSILIRATNLEITYNESKNVSGENIIPGWSDTKTFTITNTGEEAILYSLKWIDVTNTMVNKSYLTYTLVGTGTNAYNTVSPVMFPTNDEYIFNNLVVSPGVTQNYTLTVTYANDTSFDQSADMTKSFAGMLSIETSEVQE